MQIIKQTSSRNEAKSLIFWAFCALLLALSIVLAIFFNSNRKSQDLKYSATIPAPVANIPSGYSPVPIDLKFAKSAIGTTIYYTLDGSKPGPNSLQYDGNAIRIDADPKKEDFLYSIPTSPRWQPPVGEVFTFTVLRAVCVDQKGNMSKELKASYIIDPTRKHRYSVPVLSLIFDPDDLFGYEQGIYVMGKTYEDKDNYIKKKIRFDIPWWQYPANYLQRGKNSERPIFVDYFCFDTNSSFSFNSAVRIHGYNTRGFAQKSLRISMDSNVIKDTTCIDILNKGKGKGNYILRNGGNDWTKTLLRDAFIHEVMKGSTLSPQAYQPVVCFFNGEYWGIHTLRERFDELYVENKYGISKDSISILELEGDVLHGSRSESRAFKNLVDFVLKNDMSVADNYAVVEKELDIQNLIDYTITNIYFANNDWPTNNLKYWRYSYPSKDPGFRDNKWRFVLSDMDWAMGFNIDKAYEYNMFEFMKDKRQFGIMFNKLLKNNIFKEQFIRSFEDKLVHELSPEHLQKVLDNMLSELSVYMPEHINRWRVIGDYEYWQKNTQILIEFNRSRNKVISEQLKQL